MNALAEQCADIILDNYNNAMGNEMQLAFISEMTAKKIFKPQPLVRLFTKLKRSGKTPAQEYDFWYDYFESHPHTKNQMMQQMFVWLKKKPCLFNATELSEMMESQKAQIDDFPNPR